VEDVEVIPDSERKELIELGHQMARINVGVNTMRGVRRGVVVRAYEREVERLEKERYGS